jgi:hypothetical protein
MWVQFQAYFSRVSGLFSFRPVFEDLWNKHFRDLASVQRVAYVEMRGLAGTTLYDAARPQAGGGYTEEEALLLLQEIAAEVAAERPCAGTGQVDDCFLGVKMIYAPFRGASDAETRASLMRAVALRVKHPELLAGFDLVGQVRWGGGGGGRGLYRKEVNS